MDTPLLPAATISEARTQDAIRTSSESARAGITIGTRAPSTMPAARPPPMASIVRNTISVLSIDGRAFEVRQGFLAGRVVEVQSCLVDGLAPSVRVEHDGASYALRPLDVRENAKVRRPARGKAPAQKIPFDPFKPSKTK